MSPRSYRRMTMSGDTSDGRCESQDRSPSSERLRANVMARYKWTGVYIVNEVAIMSMKINVGLTFMDIAPMLKINELEDICLGQ